jgi:hypothetical protein
VKQRLGPMLGLKSFATASVDRRQAFLFVSDSYFSLLLPHGECYRPVIS